MIDHTPILITGCPRSGATTIAATINACGAFGGRMSKRGMYCNDRISCEMVKPHLKHNISDIWEFRINNILIQQGYTGGPWMYKDSNNSLIWPVWHNVFPNAKWVIVRRRTSDIINSCMKTTYMTQHYTKDGWANFVHQYEDKFLQMVEAGLNCKFIWPERMVNGDYQQMREILNWLGLSWKNEVVNLINVLLKGRN